MAALAALLQHWHRQVPYATGAAWACALEPAFRAWSWMWAYRMALASGSLDAGTHELWLTGLFDHARFLHRHLERYTSPYNHLVGEASALFALGLLLPECREAAVWVARGREVLESTLASQFHPDGGSVEQSTFYHHATLGFYLLASVLGRRAGAPLGAAVDAAIERGVAFSMALMQPDGRVPRIGGADDGKPIRLEHLPFWDFRPYQAIGAALFGRGDFAAAAGRFWEDALWVLGPEGRSAFERVAPREPARSAALRSSGYYVVRSDWSEQADYLCVDCGEQAAGLRRDGVPSAAHGHADCLSVVVALAGTPVLVDPGFYCYNGAPPWEVHFRKTAAHNTLSVDGRAQARHLSKMAWTHTYAATIEEVAEVSLGRVRASHDGYARGPAPVTHRRTAWLRPDGYVIIHDEITGTPGARVRANFQFAPGSLTAQGPGVVIFEDRFELAWAATGAVIAETTVGAEAAAAPSPGWVAPSLGIRCPAPSLQLDFQLSGRRAVLLSVLADRRRGPALADDRRTLAVAADGDDVVGVVVRGSGWDDRLVAGPGGRPIRAAGVETDAVLAVARFAGEALAESWQSGGTYVRRCASAGMADADAATPTGGLL
jgi:hypothetical protein